MTTPQPTEQPAIQPTQRIQRLPPPGFEYGEARRRYIEAFGSTQVMNRYLRLAVLALSLVAVAVAAVAIHAQNVYSGLKPLVIRIDEVGRATAINYDRLTYTPQAPELRYFLTQFVVKHYSRMRATLKQQYTESLYFLDGRLADATMQANAKTGVIEKFLASGGEEVEVRVRNVTLEDLRQPPFRATIDFELVHLAPATRVELRHDTFIAHVVFVLQEHVDNARIPINPLGLTITYLREDQAFISDDQSLSAAPGTPSGVAASVAPTAPATQTPATSSQPIAAEQSIPTDGARTGAAGSQTSVQSTRRDANAASSPEVPLTSAAAGPLAPSTPGRAQAPRTIQDPASQTPPLGGGAPKSSSPSRPASPAGQTAPRP